MFTSRFQPALSKAMDKAFKEIEEKKLIAQHEQGSIALRLRWKAIALRSSPQN